jgi:hypothetical protein
MKTASIAGTIYGNEWQTIYDSGELGSAQTSITISNLDGNTDKEYRLIARVVNGYSGVSGSFLTFNGDTGTNYGDQELYGESTTVGSVRTSPRSNVFMTAGTALGGISLFDGIIYAKSGFVRTLIAKTAYRIAGTTVEGIMSEGCVWNNTADNLTSMTLTASQINGLGVGTRIILMRRADRDASTIGKSGKINAYGKIKGCFQKIYENTLSSAAASVTISSLDGNTDLLYIIKIRSIGSGVGSPDGVFLRFNADSGSNYGYQFYMGINTSSSAGRAAFNYAVVGNAATQSGYVGLSEALIYAKSGYTRALVASALRDVTSTTVSTSMITGSSWSNTTDNITSISVLAQTGNLGTGTYIELWAYRP